MKTKREENTHNSLQLWTDGGCIGKNPSPYGGTWAWVLVHNEKMIDRDSGILHARDNPVTNNQTELLAIIEGLKSVPLASTLEICSDSNISLGRVFRGSSFNNIPFWMETQLLQVKRSFRYWDDFSYTLIGGHPTRISLKKGTNAKGHPVSRWNVLCDQMCHEEADNYWRNKNR